MVKNIILFLFLTVLLLFPSCENDNYPYFIGTPNEVAFSVIIDGSGSMSGPLPNVKTTLLSLMNTMEEEDFMQFIITTGIPYILEEWTNNKDAISASINTLTIPGGDHERYDLGIALAVENAYPGKLNCILLIGDGEIFYGSEPPPEEVYTSISNSTKGKTVVFTFGFDTFNEDVLQDIAEAGRGAFYIIDDPSNFGSYYLEIKENAINGIYNL